jgi:multiple sugar transport system permease protein
MLARLQTVPKDLIEAATVDGAGHIGRIRHVIIPWLAPVILIAMLLRTIWAGVEFDFPYLTAYGGPLSASTVVPIQIFDLYTQAEDVGRASALAVSVGILLAVAAIFYLRYYRKVESQSG